MRVKWNRQLDGSLARRQAEEEAAAVAAAQLGKDNTKHKSTPKIFRIFRRKKHSRRPDEDSDRNPDASPTYTPSEVDDEDCASISSVASQPVTELCHRDRTVSLFSSFRLNFPGGKKKSKRVGGGGGTPLFQENESENNRYSSPDLMRGSAARPQQTELSKSSPSVRNSNNDSIPGDFPSLETSVSFQQLKHAGAKGGPDVAKLAKSVSFSDCQATLNSKQVTCASARTLRTPNGPKTKCLSHSTDLPENVCRESTKSTRDGDDSLRLPTQPSCWKSAAEPRRVEAEGAMSEIVSSSNHRIEQRCKGSETDNDVRGKWFSDTHRTDLNGDQFQKSVGGPHLSDKPIVILNGKSTVVCNGSVSRDMCSAKISPPSDTSCDYARASSYTSSSDGPRTSPAQLRDNSSKVGYVHCAEKVLKSHKEQDESDVWDIMPFMKSTSQVLKNIDLASSTTDASVADASKDDVIKSHIKPLTVDVPSVLQNLKDSTFASTHEVNSEKKVRCNGDLNPEKKVLCNGDLKHTSTTVQSYSVDSDICHSNSNTEISVVSNLNMLPDSEKLLLNEMLRDFGLNTDENEEYVSSGVCPSSDSNRKDDNARQNENGFENLIKFPLNALPLGDQTLTSAENFHETLLEVPIDDGGVCSNSVLCSNPKNNSTIENTPQYKNIFENSKLSSNTLSLGNQELISVEDFNHSLLDIPFNNYPISEEIVGAQSLTQHNTVDSSELGISQDSASPSGSNFIPCPIDGNVVDSNTSDKSVKTENNLASTANTILLKLDEPSAPLVGKLNEKREPIVSIQTGNTTNLNTPLDITMKDETITRDKILEPDGLSGCLMIKENNLIPIDTVYNFDQCIASLSSEFDNEKTLTAFQENQHFSPLFLTYLKSNNCIFNDSLLNLNFLGLMPENINLCSSCSRSQKSSVLNLTCPIIHLDDLNNNALCDAESYLHKLTEASNDSVFLSQKDLGSEKNARSVTVWNASFVQNLIFPSEILPIQQQCIDSTGGRALSDHVSFPYATDCGKLRLEERCPDAESPSGSSSNIVTLQRFDLHTDGIDTTRNTGDGSEMLAKVGASTTFCEKLSNPSVFINDDDKIKDDCSEIYDTPRYPDVCDRNLISLSSESYNSFTTESCAECEIVPPDEWCVTKPSSDVPESAFISNDVQDEVVVNGRCSVDSVSGSVSLDTGMMDSGICSESMPTSDLISNGYCSGNSFQFESDDVDSTSNLHESTIEPIIKDRMVVKGTIETSSDLLSQVTMLEEIDDEFSTLNSVIPNGYHSESDLQTEIPEENCDILIPFSECTDNTLDRVTNELEINNVQEKIQFFENGSPEVSSENCDKKSTRRRGLERSKNSMIPSLRKTCLKAVNEKQFQSQKLESKKFKNEEITQPSNDNDSSLTKPETIDEFENIYRVNSVLSENNDTSNSSCVNGENWSLEPECNHLNDSGLDNERHFVIEVSCSSSSEFSERCRSEELLSGPSKVQKFKSRLQTRRHSSTETNSCDIAREGGKVTEKALTTTDLASPVDKEASVYRSSNLTLNEGPGFQGQSRCASLPLVIGQVRATSPSNYARRNGPIKDAPRGKSRIPRKQGGMRGALHPKGPVRPPMWLSKAELSAEIQRLGTLCEARTKELNRLKMETKHVSSGFDAFASLFKYMVEDMNALSMPVLAEDLKKTLKQLELAKQDLAYYEREVEEMKAHHCQELNDLSNKLFEVFHGEVTELSAKHQEEMNRMNGDHQLQIENLSSTFDVSSHETFAKHEAAVAKLQQELISQREELRQLHEREISDLEEKHSQSNKTLQEHIEQLQKKCAELKQHSMGMEDAMRKDTDSKLQWVTSRKGDLEKEVESLKAVLEMKNKELHTLRVQNLEMEKQLEELPLAREKIKMLQARAEDLEALMIEKTKLERKLCTENQAIRDTYERESKVNKRLSMENEELLWRIKQTDQSFLSDSFSVAEYPEDVENGSISPTKSPPPHMSRSVFFTYMDKEDQTSSPRSHYKKIMPGFAAGYKTSPHKSPSPRRAHSNSEPPQPPSHSTPRKASKQTPLKQQKKRQRSGSDCGKVSCEQADQVTFLSVAGSMTSSVSSESSVFGERLLEEHKEQILESLEILREQRSTESDRCPEGSSSKGEEVSSPNLESEDMSRSSEFSDPKTYYHMTFPVSGMPDCDINATAQAIHSTSESSTPVDDRLPTQQIVPSQETDVSVGDCTKELGNDASSEKMAHSFENVRESECEKQFKEDRWRTI